MRLRPQRQPHAGRQTMLFWRARAPDSNESWWEGERGGGQNWTCQLLGQHRSRKERGGGGRRQHVWWEVLSCIGKMTLAELKGFLLLKPSCLLPPSVPLPSPNCVLPPGDETFRQGLAFPQSTSRKKSGFRTEVCTFSQLPVFFSSVCKLQNTVSTPAYFWSGSSLIEAKSN